PRSHARTRHRGDRRVPPLRQARSARRSEGRPRARLAAQGSTALRHRTQSPLETRRHGQVLRRQNGQGRNARELNGPTRPPEIRSMKDFIELVSKKLVQHPEDVQVRVIESDGEHVYELRVNP